MIIRKADLKDIEHITKLIAPFIDEFAINLQGREHFSQDRIHQMLMMENLHYFVAEQENQQIIAIAAYKKPAHLIHFFVDQHYQRQGIGRQIWDFIKTDAKKQIITKFTVDSSCNAQKVYEAFGFVQTEPVTEQSGLRFVPMVKHYELDNINN